MMAAGPPCIEPHECRMTIDVLRNCAPGMFDTHMHKHWWACAYYLLPNTKVVQRWHVA